MRLEIRLPDQPDPLWRQCGSLGAYAGRAKGKAELLSEGKVPLIKGSK